MGVSKSVQCTLTNEELSYRLRDVERILGVMQGQVGYITTCFEAATNKMLKKPSIQDLLRMFQEESEAVAHAQPGLTVSAALITVAERIVERLDSES